LALDVDRQALTGRPPRSKLQDLVGIALALGGGKVVARPQRRRDGSRVGRG
jgi:hypothetical protein